MMEYLRELPMKLGYGASIMVLGMTIVFLGLVILIVCINILAKLTAEKKVKKEAEAPVVVPAPVAEAAAAQTNASADELVAVITAALMAYMASEGTASSGKKLVVRNIRAAAAQQNAWARAGRVNQINNRF